MSSGRTAGVFQVESAGMTATIKNMKPTEYKHVVALIEMCIRDRQVALLKAEAADAFINAYLALGGPALDELLALARAVGDEYAALKAERSALDNNDLLRLTYEALRDHPRIRDAYAGKFAMVMICLLYTSRCV